MCKEPPQDACDTRCPSRLSRTEQTRKESGTPHRTPRARRASTARASVRRLRTTTTASDEAWAKLERALARGNVTTNPAEYLARIVRFEGTSEYLTTRLPDGEELAARFERAD